MKSYKKSRCCQSDVNYYWEYESPYEFKMVETCSKCKNKLRTRAILIKPEKDLTLENRLLIHKV